MYLSRNAKGELHMVNGECFSGAFTAAFSGAGIGVAASRQSAPSEKEREVCGGLPTRRYEAGESFAVPLKIRATLPNGQKTKTSAVGAAYL